MKHSIYLFVIIGLIFTNILTLSNNSFHNLLYKGVSHIPFEYLTKNSPSKKYESLNSKHNNLKIKNKELTSSHRLLKANYNSKLNNIKKTKNIAQRISARSAKNAIVNISAIPAESVPYLGISFIVAATAYDINDACSNMKDMDEIMSILEIESDNDKTTKICGQTLPGKEILVSYVTLTNEQYNEVKTNIGGFLYSLKENASVNYTDFSNALGGTIHELLK